MHTVNSQKLKQLIKDLGQGGLAQTAHEAKVGISTLEKMCLGAYRSSPGRAMRSRLSAYFGVAESDLFPLARKKAA